MKKIKMPAYGYAPPIKPLTSSTSINPYGARDSIMEEIDMLDFTDDPNDATIFETMDEAIEKLRELDPSVGALIDPNIIAVEHQSIFVGDLELVFEEKEYWV